MATTAYLTVTAIFADDAPKGVTLDTQASNDRYIELLTRETGAMSEALATLGIDKVEIDIDLHVTSAYVPGDADYAIRDALLPMWRDTVNAVYERGEWAVEA